MIMRVVEWSRSRLALVLKPKKIDIIIYFMARKFDEEKCLAFPKAHILTGCDGTSRVTAFEAKPNW